MVNIDPNSETDIREPAGSRFVFWAVIVMFFLVELMFLFDISFLFTHHALWGHLVSIIAVQISLIVSLVCLVRLSRKKYIHRYWQANWDHSTLYSSLAALAMLNIFLLYRDILNAIYQIRHAG